MTSSATPARMTSGSAARLRHMVQFYGANDELVEGVSAYLHDGLIAGGTVIVVATPAHQSAFANALSNAGVDVAAAIFEDRLIQRDASELLSRFTRGDTLGHAEFEDLMEKLVGPALERGGPVRIYGEMVATLWGRGNINAALELERFWNKLADRLPFFLYCGYPTTAGTGQDGEVAALRDVCNLHSALHGSRSPTTVTNSEHPQPVVRFFDRSTDSPRKARQLVREVLGQWGDGELAGDMALVVSELATNAIRHTRDGFRVELSRTAQSVFAAVSDSSSQPPEPRVIPVTAGSGRGLAIVAAVASRWGHERSATGKLVWAELAR
jgi:anti-sigma regulatory factor (Ser/Thr protein kinase)